MTVGPSRDLPSEYPTVRKPAPGRKPTSIPSASKPEERLTPKAPPLPVFQANGFHGSPQEATTRLQTITDAHERAFGYKPKPAVAFDLFRSPVRDADLAHLFNFPKSKGQALGRAAVVSQGLANRPDEGQLGAETRTVRDEGITVSRHDATQAQLADIYPTVEAGFLPVSKFGQVIESVGRLNELAADGSIQVRSQGMTLADFEGLAQGLTNSDVEKARAGQLSASESVGGRAQDMLAAVTTIASAQRELNRMMGTTLPITGVFGDDWQRALSTWTKSVDYRRKVVEFQARDAGYEGDVGGYLKSWRAKQHAVESNGLLSHFLEAMPLQLFGSGDVDKGVFAYLTHDGKYILKPSPDSLHMLTRSAGLALNTIGGTIDEAKAYAAAGSAFTQEVGPTLGSQDEHTFEEAKDKAKAALKAHPSWLRVFYPDLPEHPEGALKALDDITNIVGDLVLLGKPKFTGERVAAGDVAKASSSRYVTYASKYAYNDLKAGNLGRAASRLEGKSVV